MDDQVFQRESDNYDSQQHIPSSLNQWTAQWPLVHAREGESTANEGSLIQQSKSPLKLQAMFEADIDEVPHQGRFVQPVPRYAYIPFRLATADVSKVDPAHAHLPGGTRH